MSEKQLKEKRKEAKITEFVITDEDVIDNE